MQRLQGILHLRSTCLIRLSIADSLQGGTCKPSLCHNCSWTAALHGHIHLPYKRILLKFQCISMYGSVSLILLLPFLLLLYDSSVPHAQSAPPPPALVARVPAPFLVPAPTTWRYLQLAMFILHPCSPCPSFLGSFSLHCHSVPPKLLS